MLKRTAAVTSCAMVIVAVLATAAIRQVTVLVLDVPEHRATLLVKRSAAYEMRLLESEASICERQRPGSPLHSVYLSASFCPLAMATSTAASGSNVLLRLPFVPALHGWAR